MTKKELALRLSKVLDVSPLIGEIIVEKVYALAKETEDEKDEELHTIQR